MTQFEVAQILADKEGITREEMDAFSAESHRAGPGRLGQRPLRRRGRARAGQGSPTATSPARCWTRDEGIRPETTVETLAALGSAAKWDPTIAPDITAGNASQMSDGAAAMLIADAATAERLGLPVRARFVQFAVGGEDAVLVLSAPEPGHPPAARAQSA